VQTTAFRQPRKKKKKAKARTEELQSKTRESHETYSPRAVEVVGSTPRTDVDRVDDNNNPTTSSTKAKTTIPTSPNKLNYGK
jgi:hypothetical protein